MKTELRRFMDGYGMRYAIRVYPNGVAKFNKRLYTSFGGAKRALNRYAGGFLTELKQKGGEAAEGGGKNAAEVQKPEAGGRRKRR